MEITFENMVQSDSDFVFLLTFVFPEIQIKIVYRRIRDIS